MRKVIYAFFATMLIFSLTACKSQPVVMKDSTFNEFNTISTVTAYDYSQQDFDKLKNIVFTELAYYHKLYDSFNLYDGINNIKTINDNSGIKPVKVDKDIIDIINFSLEQSKLTNGYFNIAFGSITEVWRENAENSVLPSDKELADAYELTNIENIVIDEDNSTVFLSKKGMRLDLGAVAKGYVADRIALKAIENGYENFMLDLGGNIKAVGDRVEGEPWLIGVSSGEDVIKSVELTNKSAVTSSGEIRLWEIDGEKYHHIIDKDTLYPSVHHKSVTVIAENSALADVLSTALFCVNYDDGLKMLNKYENIEVVWTLIDGEVIEN